MTPSAARVRGFREPCVYLANMGIDCINTFTQKWDKLLDIKRRAFGYNILQQLKHVRLNPRSSVLLYQEARSHFSQRDHYQQQAITFVSASAAKMAKHLAKAIEDAVEEREDVLSRDLPRH